MDFLQLCHDYGLPVAPHGHKHERAGWVNTVCPFCVGHSGYHLGYEIHGQYGFVCFRCGGHGIISTLTKLLNITSSEARNLISDYGGLPRNGQKTTRKIWKYETDVKWPMGTHKLDRHGRNYLRKRNFDPSLIESLYGVRQTGPVGFHRHRLVIPIIYHGHMVSWTCRAIHGSEIRYITCNEKDEAIPSKDILYNYDNLIGRNRIVVVEGCTDVWRLGHGAVATFGTKVTASQAKILTRFNRIFLYQDLDEAGTIAWRKVSGLLRAAGCEVITIKPREYEDPSEMSDVEAQYLMRNLR